MRLIIKIKYINIYMNIYSQSIGIIWGIEKY